MSRLFVESGAIHRRFLDLLTATEGLAGVIDLEDGTYLLLDDPAKAVRVGREEFELPGGSDEVDIDRFTEALLQEIGRETG